MQKKVSLGPRINSLTSVRGLAALWVVLFHFFPEFEKGLPELKAFQPFTGLGLWAVDFFFMLSGFTIYYNYSRFFDVPKKDLSSRYLEFLTARLARIYPLHFVTLVVVGIMVFVAGRAGMELDWTGYTPRLLLENVFLVHAWFTDKLSWNFPSWSISSEWMAYLLFPLFVILCRSFKSLKAAAIGLALMLATLEALSLLSDFTPTIRVLGGFPLGCLVARCVELRSNVGGSQERHVAKRLKVFALAGITLGPFLWTYSCSALLPFFVLLIWALGIEGVSGPPRGFLTSKPVVYLGTISYSIYLTHTLILKLVIRGLYSPMFVHSPCFVRVATLVGILASVIFIAALSYEWVELPGQSLKRRLLGEKVLNDS